MTVYILYFLFLSSWILIKSFGESSFLGDQIDQIQSADALWSGRLISFYGPYLSTTNPTVYPFGPATYLIISLLKILHLPIPYFQLSFGVLNVIIALLLLNELSRIDVISGKIFSLLIPFSSVYIFSLSMFWNNVLIFSFSSLFFLFILKFYQNPRGIHVLWIIQFFILGLHLHLIGIILLPVILFLFLRGQKEWNSGLALPSTWNRILVWICLFFSIAPYLIAELIRKFKNTKNLFSNSKLRLEENLDISSLKILVLDFLIPLDLDFTLKVFIATCFLLILFFIIIYKIKNYFRNRRNPQAELIRKRSISNLFWFVSLISFISLLSELVFFILTRQPIRSIHYQAYLTPISLIWVCVFLSFLIQKGKLMNIKLISNYSEFFLLAESSFQKKILYYLFLIIMLFYTKSYENKYKSNWAYDTIIKSLDDICEERPNVSTFEVEAFRSPHSEFKPVLQYLIEARLTRCSFDPNSKLVLVPYTFGNSEELLSRYPIEKKLEFIRDYPPGIGMYFQTNR